MSFGEHKKIYFLLGAMCFIIFLLLVRQLYLVNALTIQRDNDSIVSPNTYALPYDKNRPTFGNPGAPVTVAIFSDLSCKECQKLVSEVYEFVQRHPLNVKLAWFDAPKSSLFFDRTLPHKAARCAFAQDAFWPFVDRIFAVSGNHKRDFLETAAKNSGLDTEKWSTCLALKETADAVERDSNLADEVRAHSLPMLFINNKNVTLVKGIDVTAILTQVIAPTP